MAQKANTAIDQLNKILTNTLDYKEVLVKLAQSTQHEATREKLREFAEVREKESQNLMEAVKELGGRIESNERTTDQESVYWVPRPLPEGSDMKAVLSKLITAEKNAQNDYDALLKQEDVKTDVGQLLKKHKQEAEANLEYFQSSRQSLEKKPT